MALIRIGIGSIFKIIIFFYFLLNSVFSYASKYDLLSIEGKKIQVYIGDDIDQLLYVAYGQDTIYALGNSYNEFNVTHVAPSFIQIVYSTRGGSSFKVQEVFWVCVHNNKPHIAIHMLYSTFYNPNELIGKPFDDKTTTTFKLQKVNDSFYLNIDRHYISEFSGTAKKDWQNYIKKRKLKFDPDKNIFFDRYKFFDGNYSIDYWDVANKSKKALHNKYPGFIVDKDEYYFIEGIWYALVKTKAGELVFVQCTY